MIEGERKPDTRRILSQLKDFQRHTVDYVYRRLYEDANPADRFLIADEVGLGKTIVAKGIITRAIDRLWEQKDHRIDILYICSNGDIARQNINKLNLTGEEEVAFASRMTLLPLEIPRLRGRRLNFVSFTPGTSFNLRSAGGVARERALLYHILRKGWQLGDALGYKQVLRGDVGRDNWDSYLERFVTTEHIDPELERDFLAALDGAPDIQERFRSLALSFGHLKNGPSWQLRQDQMKLIGDLRRVLARCCLRSLEPDIIILDEFQRFKDLLDGTDEVADLARSLFNYDGAKVLLLSATPYKMYTLHQETADDDHYRDFIRTVKFLQQSEAKTAQFEADLARYRQELYHAAEDGEGYKWPAKDGIEQTLRRVMVRTERLGATAGRDGMLTESRSDLGGLAPVDLQAFALVDRVARHLGVGDTVEYWKSAPYLLNVMDRDGYKLKQKFVQAAESPDGAPGLVPLLESGQAHLLPWERIRRYEPVEPGNAKLRKLLEHSVGHGAWQLLWVPPSLPYYQTAAGPYADLELRDFTKALVFSSWAVVPKVIALLTSYEAERQMVTAFDPGADYETERTRRRGLISFSQKDGYRTGMFNFTLLYPCWTLAAAADPMVLGAAMAAGAEPPTMGQVADKITEKVRERLAPVLARYGQAGGDADGRWYWAAPLLLDAAHAREQVAGWLARTGEDGWGSMVPGTDDDGESNFADHVSFCRDVFDGRQELGRVPDDLVPMMVKIALASPAVAALRALLRLGADPTASSGLLGAAAQVALGFRSLFNLPESMTMIRSLRHNDDARYWESVLDYCADGNLQSVLDEYMHLLQDGLGVTHKPVADAAAEIAEEIQTALSLRTVTLEIDEVQLSGGGDVELKRRRMRCRYALRFGDGKEEEAEGGEPTRADQVRKAFNSPFRPFVVASTSVGQEGLDFHPYCHEIYHWNLPSNPVDLEQREGRIHRYKGHVIRRNVAAAVPLAMLASRVSALSDPWAALFEEARRLRKPGQNDLVPYWVFEQGHHRIVRHVPALPLSRDVEHLEGLHRTLAAYRMVFGQPRQEDLLAYLRERAAGDGERYRIDLSPASWARSGED